VFETSILLKEPHLYTNMNSVINKLHGLFVKIYYHRLYMVNFDLTI